ncbi:MAG: hypothetical protein JSS96_17305 [Bacteroidetes bacterium]|nr:hypothetical protein [Bacteroidota bacterium]
MTKLLSILLILLPTISNAQIAADNSISLSTPTPLVFSYSSVDELLAPKVLHNAIEIKLSPKRYSRNIMAYVTFTGPLQNAVPADWLTMNLAGKTSVNAVIYKAQNQLSTVPVALFTQPPSPTNEDLTFYYDIMLSPLNTFVNTGSYNFNIIISITQS